MRSSALPLRRLIYYVPIPGQCHKLDRVFGSLESCCKFDSISNGSSSEKASLFCMSPKDWTRSVSVIGSSSGRWGRSKGKERPGLHHNV